MEKERERWRSDEGRDTYHLGQRERERGRDGREETLQNKHRKEDATAAAFVKRCQIFNPRVLSVLPCNRW